MTNNTPATKPVASFTSPVGYSGKSLIKKLGYQPSDHVYVLGAPAEFSAYLASEAIEVSADLPATWAHAFFTTTDDLSKFLGTVKLEAIEKGLWVSWPKKASGVKTDLTEQTFRDHILPLGWVDTKVAAVDETWSGLKFLRRKSGPVPSPLRGEG